MSGRASSRASPLPHSTDVQQGNTVKCGSGFAGLAVLILIGLLVENLVFDTLERLTVKRWGMQR